MCCEVERKCGKHYQEIRVSEWRLVESSLSLSQPAVYRLGQPCQTTLIPAHTHTHRSMRAHAHTQIERDLRPRVNPPSNHPSAFA